MLEKKEYSTSQPPKKDHPWKKATPYWETDSHLSIDVWTCMGGKDEKEKSQKTRVYGRAVKSKSRKTNANRENIKGS
jgi:hypothetical protein